MELNKKEAIWTKWFIIAAVIQGAIIVGITFFLVIGDATITKPTVSMVIASGSAGTWVAFGYVMYVMVGVIGVAVSALFYHYIEQTMGQQYCGYNRILPAIHLVLMNVGSSAAMSMMMYVGYAGGTSMLSPAVGGGGLDSAHAHELIMAPFVAPIGFAIIVILIGVLAGGLGFILTYRKNNKEKL